MNITPTINSSKPFAWSYSKLKNFDSCPRRYYEVDVIKAWPQPKTPDLERGDALHAAMAKRVKLGTALPMEFSYMEPWAEKLTKVISPAQAIAVELKLAATKDMKPTSYFAKNVWLRGVIDYIQLSPLHSNGDYKQLASIIDYKTGKPREDETQLALNACLVFAHYPDVVGASTSFLWTEYNDTMHVTFKRKDAKDIWENVKPRVAKLEQATIEGEFPPTKNYLCREYCPVLSCEFNGKR
jgi:hypothetical protein